MAMNRKQKEDMVGEMREHLTKAGAVVIASYPGTTVHLFTGFRKKARENNVYVRVVKNRLAKIAVKDTPFEGLAEHMKGQLIYGVGEDSVSVAKLFKEFSKETATFNICVGAIPDTVLSAAQVEVLASMPSREELLASLAGTLQAPVTKFVRTLNEVPSKFVRTLAAVRDAKPA